MELGEFASPGLPRKHSWKSPAKNLGVWVSTSTEVLSLLWQGHGWKDSHTALRCCQQLRKEPKPTTTYTQVQPHLASQSETSVPKAQPSLGSPFLGLSPTPISPPKPHDVMRKTLRILRSARPAWKRLCRNDSSCQLPTPRPQPQPAQHRLWLPPSAAGLASLLPSEMLSVAAHCSDG